MNPKRIGQLIIIIIVLVAGYIFYAQVFGAATINKTFTPDNLSTNLTGHWTFDGPDMINNVADVSGQGNTGYLENFTSTTTVSGKLGQALDFDGVNDAVDIALDSSIMPGTGDFSVSFWYKGGSGTFLDQGFCTSGDKPCWQINDGAVSFSMDSFPLAVAANAYTLPDDNEWHHFTAVLDRNPSPDTLVVYIDGDTTGSQTSNSLDNHNLTVINTTTRIGGWSAVVTPRTGPMDDVRIYQRALSANEVNQLYNATKENITNKKSAPATTLTTGLTGHWTFDGPDLVSNVADVSGNDRDGFLTNFTSTTTSIGKVGQALNFDAVNDYVKVSDVTNLMSAATGTVSVWMRPTGAPLASDFPYALGVVFDGNTAWGGPAISRGSLSGDDKIWVWNSDGVFSFDQVGVPYNVDEWVNIVWVHSLGTLYAYKNGELVGSTPSGDTNGFTGDFWIGLSWGGGSFTGDIDDVRTWNRALSADEIKQVYDSTKGAVANKTISPQTSMQTGLTGHWTFDGPDIYENIGDVSGNDYDAHLVGFTSTTTAVGRMGQALNFDGVDDYAQTDSATGFNLWTVGEKTVSAWVRPVGPAPGVGASYTGQNFIGLSSALQSFGMGRGVLSGADEIRVFNDDTFGAYDDAGFTYSLGEWVHVVGVHSGGALSIYKNGEFVESTASGNSIGISSNLRIGSNWTGTTWNGDVDDVRTWNRGLSSSEIKQLYNIGR